MSNLSELLKHDKPSYNRHFCWFLVDIPFLMKQTLLFTRIPALTIVALFCVLYAIAQRPLPAQTPASFENELTLYGEAWGHVPLHHPYDATVIASVTSVAGGTQDTLLVNVNRDEYERLIALGFKFIHQPLSRPSALHLMQPAGKIMGSWTAYPTYPGFDSIMHAFPVLYPGLCQTFDFLTLSSGRKLLIAKLTSPVNPVGGKPRFLYSSTMHGNETAGYILMLRLMDHLLSGYGVDPEATWILDNMEVWIAPLANPDGTYHGGDHTVAGAIRRNGNNVDLNRNYPDPRVGANPDGHPYQAETVAFMHLSDTLDFTMGANLHSGAEVVNYPWDTWVKTHPDDNWWRYVSRNYADTVHGNAPPGFFTDLNNGITNGAAWYIITGGRQDYMNYAASCRELTLEVSGLFIEPVNRLQTMWDYHHRSLINYLKEGWYGMRGTVTDSVTGNPLRARVAILQHDADSSHVWSGSSSGHYYRPIEQGTYQVTFSAQGYHPKTLQVIVQQGDTTIRNVQLVPVNFRVSKAVFEDVDFWFDESSGCIRFKTQPPWGSQLQVYTSTGGRNTVINSPGVCTPLTAVHGFAVVALVMPDGTRIQKKMLLP